MRLFALATVILLFTSFSASASIFFSSTDFRKFFPPGYIERYSKVPLELSFMGNVKVVEDFAPWKEKLAKKVSELIQFPTDSKALQAIREPRYAVLAKHVVEEIEVVKIGYPAFDGDEVLAYLLRATSLGDGEKRPGLVVISGHPASGKAARALVEDNRDYQRAIALELAKNGYAVIVPELRTYGERAIGTHEAYANYLQMLGKPVIMLWVTEILQAANILKSLSHVDTRKIGTVGISTGGLLSYLSAVFDPDIKAVVSASGLVSYLRVSAGLQDLHDQIPTLLRYADYPDLAALIAPRPMLIAYGLNEGGAFQYEAEALISYSYLKQAYQLLGAEKNLVLNLHNQEHSYDVEAVLFFLNEYLRG